MEFTPTSDNKAIARAAASAFGGRPSVDQYWDDPRRASIDMLACPEAPWAGVTSYATIGLSDAPLFKNRDGLVVGVELVGACSSAAQEFANYLATAAFCVINSDWHIAPGIIFPGVLSMFDASPTMDHFLFVPPFLWEGSLRTLTLDQKQVAWLMAVPISDAELDYANKQGPDALESLFEQQQIDVFDINRQSVV